MATFKSYCIDTDGRPERSKFGGNFEMVRPECEDGPCRIVIKVWRAQQSGMEPISIADIPEHRCVVTGKFDDDADFDRVMSLIDAVMKESGTSDGWFFGPAPGRHATNTWNTRDEAKARAVSIDHSGSFVATRLLTLTWRNGVPSLPPSGLP